MGVRLMSVGDDRSLVAVARSSDTEGDSDEAVEGTVDEGEDDVASIDQPAEGDDSA